VDPARTFMESLIPSPELENSQGHVWTYMDPALLQQADWIQCNSHNC
jgi:hypothetical protein